MILQNELFVYRVIVGSERYCVASYVNEELALSQLDNLRIRLKSFEFPEDSLLILEVWRLNTFLDDDSCEVLQSFPLR